jgi:predicted metal-dependent enzyme (double-stranded beta helix superfamily)
MPEAEGLTASQLATTTGPLREFIESLSSLLDRRPQEPEILEQGGAMLARLVSRDDWLPAEYAVPAADRYQQFLLHMDSAQRFCIVSFVWGPGQKTPIHDHTLWGLIGMLRGMEYSQPYRLRADGNVEEDGPAIRLQPGQVEAVSPRVGDIHRVSNAFDDRASISVHVYGGNIGAVRRSVYATDGARKPFISGYSNIFLPNIWDLSKL